VDEASLARLDWPVVPVGVRADGKGLPAVELLRVDGYRQASCGSMIREFKRVTRATADTQQDGSATQAVVSLLRRKEMTLTMNRGRGQKAVLSAFKVEKTPWPMGVFWPGRYFGALIPGVARCNCRPPPLSSKPRPRYLHLQ